MNPSSTSSSVMPPFCTMWTWPSILRTLHVPQIPIERPDGITSPAALPPIGALTDSGVDEEVPMSSPRRSARRHFRDSKGGRHSCA